MLTALSELIEIATATMFGEDATASPTARQQDGEAEPQPDTRRFLTAVHALRQIDRAVITTATNLGARDRIQVPRPTAS